MQGSALLHAHLGFLLVAAENAVLQLRHRQHEALELLEVIPRSQVEPKSYARTHFLQGQFANSGAAVGGSVVLEELVFEDVGGGHARLDKVRVKVQQIVII